MSTKITLNYKNQDYTLEYSRNAVRQMEEQGFVLDQLTEKPVSMIPRLVYGAFIKNHKGIKRNLVDEIYENIANKPAITAMVSFRACLKCMPRL